MDHPIIRKMERDGFLEPDEPIGYDYFGRPYYQDDEFYEFDGQRFLVRELSQDTIEIFEYLGAKKSVLTGGIKVSCKYCTATEHKPRSALYVDKYLMRGNRMVNDRWKRNVTMIYRTNQRRRRYFIGTHSKDFLSDGKTLSRNNGFIMKRFINFCPICGKDLSAKKVCATNTDR